MEDTARCRTTARDQAGAEESANPARAVMVAALMEMLVLLGGLYWVVAAGRIDLSVRLTLVVASALLAGALLAGAVAWACRPAESRDARRRRTEQIL